MYYIFNYVNIPFHAAAKYIIHFTWISYAISKQTEKKHIYVPA